MKPLERTTPVRPAMVDPGDVWPVAFWGAQTVIKVRCPYCEEIHTHRWRPVDSAPGGKYAPCRRQARYLVPPPLAPSPGEVAWQVGRARAALDALEACSTDASRPRDLTTITLLAAALVGAIDRVTLDQSPDRRASNADS